MEGGERWSWWAELKPQEGRQGVDGKVGEEVKVGVVRVGQDVSVCVCVRESWTCRPEGGRAGRVRWC